MSSRDLSAAARYYRRARFLTSAAQPKSAPPDEGHEIAFAGRSNAGKSSAINVLCDQQGLARTSRTPGRTQLLNFFQLDEQRRLVDLPGYGYAQVAVSIKKEWQRSLAKYLERRECLAGLVVLSDVRHPLKELDRQLIEWAVSIPLPVHVLLTKTDKLNRKASGSTLAGAREYLEPLGVSVQLFSALKRYGLDDAHAVLDQWLQIDRGN